MRFHGTTGAHRDWRCRSTRAPGGTSRIRIDDGRDLYGGGLTVEEFPPCDQYTFQGDAVLAGDSAKAAQPPVPLEDSVRNMAVIDAVFRAAESGGWVAPVTTA